MTKLNIEAIKEGQRHNSDVIERINKEWDNHCRTLNEIIGGSFGYKPGDVPEMAWLGVGDLSSPLRHDEITTTMMPPFMTLGGDQLVDTGNHFPDYQKLKRQPSLTGKCPVVSDNSKLQSWYEKVWNNERLVYYVYDNEWACKGDEKFKIIVTTDDDRYLLRYCTPKDKTKLLTVDIPFYDWPSLAAEHKQLLFFRIMHNFLRLFAYRLPVDELWRFINGYMEDMSPLASKKHKLDYLDWVMLKADLLLHLPIPPDRYGEVNDERMSVMLHESLKDVGKALASLERFDDAALIMTELAETFPNDHTSYFNAGSTLHILGNEEAALDCYAKHIGRMIQDDSDNVDLGVGSKYETIIVALIHSYFCKFENRMAGIGVRTPLCSMTMRLADMPEEAAEAMGCLCLIAAAVPDFEKLVEVLLAVDPERKFLSYLKPQYCRPGKAKRKLVDMMRSGCITEFKKVVVDVMDRNRSFRIMPVLDTSHSKKLREFDATNVRKKTQGLKREEKACRFCDKYVEKMLRCPCKTVYYCSVDCQRAHWDSHKNMCWYRLKKMVKYKRELP